MTQTASSAQFAQDKPEPNRKELRQQMLRLRRETALEQRQQWDALIGQALLAWGGQNRPASLAVYWPIQAEPDLRAVYPALSALGIQLCLPWVQAAGSPLKFLAWQQGDAMLQDQYGIPLPAQRSRLIEPAALLIPCVAFSPQAYRLGYGGGFYDRSLPLLAQAKTIGIAYQQAQQAFAAEAHDIPLQTILTEAGWLTPAA